MNITKYRLNKKPFNISNINLSFLSTFLILIIFIKKGVLLCFRASEIIFKHVFINFHNFLINFKINSKQLKNITKYHSYKKPYLFKT